MNTNKPLISIIMPAYNVENYLIECLDSVITQSYQNLEIICIDDGSTDSTATILDEYANKDSRIRVIHNENQGYGKTMNQGLKEATGEWIGVVETDDYIDSTMFESLLSIAIRENVEVVKSDYVSFLRDEDGTENETYVSLEKFPGKQANLHGYVINPAEDLSVFDSRVNTWVGLYNTEFLRKYNILHNETPGASYQDNGFWFQVMTQVSRLYIIPQAYYHLRRDNPNSSMLSKAKAYCLTDELEFIWNFLSSKESLKSTYGSIFWKLYFQKCYYFNMRRISEEYREDFLCYFVDFWMKNINDIDETHFDVPYNEMIKEIANNPKEYYALNKTRWE